MTRKRVEDLLSAADRAALTARLATVVGSFSSKAAAAQVAGVSAEQIRCIATGESVPHPITLMRLTERSGHDLHWVWTGRGQPLRSAPHWPTVDDGAAVASHEQAGGDALERAGAGNAFARAAELPIYLRHKLEPRLLSLYDRHDLPLDQRYLDATLAQLRDVIGTGEPEPVFTPIQWPLLTQIALSAHEAAVQWCTSVTHAGKTKKR